MRRFAALIALAVLFVVAAWLALGERAPHAPAATTEASRAETTASPSLVDAPEVDPAPDAPAKTEPAAPSARQAIASSDESEHTRPTLHPDVDAISGHVLWPDGTPAKALVSAVDESAIKNGNSSTEGGAEQQTSDDGSFQISERSSGPFRVQARGKRISQEQRTLDEDEHEQKDNAFWFAEQEHVERGTTDLVLTLSSGLEISGRVVDERGGSVGDFTVSAQRAGRSVPWSNATNTFSRSFHGSDGAFVLPGFSPGAWELRVEAKGYADSEARRIDVPLAAPLELVLLHTATVRGVVLDPHGTPIAGAKVRAVEDRQWLSHRNEGIPPSDESGGFIIDWLLPGHVTLSASVVGWASSKPLVLELTPGQVQDDVVLRLRTGGTIVGAVLGPGSIPEVEQFVHLSEQRGTGYSDGAETISAGRFAFTDVPAGEYSIQARTSTGLELSTEITLREGENGHVQLGPPAIGVVKLHGRVTIGGKAFREIRFSARHGRGNADTRSSETQCDSNGAYELIVPSAGHYELSVLIPGNDVFSWMTTVDIPQVPEFTFDLDVPVGRVRGRVTSRDGAPLADVAVRNDVDRVAAADGLFKHYRTHTDADGHYELLVSAGPLTVIAGGKDWPWNENAASWSEARAEGLSLAANQELLGIDFVLSAGGTLAGRVRRSDGGLLRQAIILDYGATPEQMIASAEEDGRFQVQGLEPGILLVGARAVDVATLPMSVTIEAGKTTEVELVLAPAIRAGVHVRDADGAVDCVLTALDDKGHDCHVRSLKKAGEFEVGPLPAGRYTLRAEHDGKHAERTLEIRGDEKALEVELELE